MRAVVQRVREAKVEVDGNTVSAIGSGLLIFLGVGEGDDEQDADYLAEKILNLRIFEDEEEKMNLSVREEGGEVMVVSQFTLFGDCRKGRRPSFFSAMEPGRAEELYEYFTAMAGKSARVAKGVFQAYMQVSLVNDGPVTILLDSRKGF